MVIFNSYVKLPEGIYSFSCFSVGYPQVFPQDALEFFDSARASGLAIRCEAFPAGIRAQDPADRRTSLGGDPGGWLEKPLQGGAPPVVNWL